MADRREFLTALLAAGALPGASKLLAEDPGLARTLDQTAPLAAVDERALEFWTTFLQREPTPARPGAAATRQDSGDLAPYFLFYTKDSGFQAAHELPADQLIPSGDLNVSMNVAAFKPAKEDRNTFERLQNAQLRLDVVQSNPFFTFMDPVAWTAVAALHPTKEGKLPALQNLSFDPSSASSKMQTMTLPGGEGRWAINLTMQRKDSFFSQILKQAVPEIGKFAPFIGMPAISVIALNSFNAFYGRLHDQSESLLKSAPVAIYGTAAALKDSGSTTGVPLRAGTYVLVPANYAKNVPDDRLKTLQVTNGFVVPSGTKESDIYVAADSALSDVTYATVEVSVKAATPATGGRGGHR